MKYFLGIDVGYSGAMVVIDSEANIVENIKMPSTLHEQALTIMDIGYRYDGNIKCVIEEQHPRPTDGAVSIATYFEHYGCLKVALMISGMPYEFISAKKWQKYYNMKRNSTDSRDEFKRKLKQLAIQRFGNPNITLYNADAHLIAEYARKNY